MEGGAGGGVATKMREVAEETRGGGKKPGDEDALGEDLSIPPTKKSRPREEEDDRGEETQWQRITGERHVLT